MGGALAEISALYFSMPVLPICPFSIVLILNKMVDKLEPTYDFGQEAGYTIGWPPVNHRAHTFKQPFTLSFKAMENVESEINKTCMFLEGERKLDSLERTHAITGRTRIRRKA